MKIADYLFPKLDVQYLSPGTVPYTWLATWCAISEVTGFVPHAHLSDSGVFIDPKKANISKLPKKKYKVGQEIKARVLLVDVSKQSLILTLKPSLLSSDLEVLQSYEQAQIGKAYTGVIKHIRDYLLVSFFNNVVAFVSPKLVSKEPIDNLTHAFHVGQIVNCTILKVDVDSKKMLASLITQPFTPSEKKEKAEKRKLKMNTDISSKKQKPNDKHKEENHRHNSQEQTESETDTRSKKKKDKKIARTESVADTEIAKTQKRKKDKKSISEDESQDDVHEVKIDRKERKKKKKLVEDDESKKISEESDAIETDIHEEELLTPHELGLIDLSDCSTAKLYKKRIVSLLKAVQSRTRRIDKIEKKILDIEEKGLNTKNKKFHTAMHVEKLGLQERIQKIMDVLTVAQENLKEFGDDDKGHERSKKDKRKLESLKEKDPTKGESQIKRKEIKVVETLEPALDVPSAKDFWAASEDRLVQNEKEEESSSSEDEVQEQPKKKRKKLTVAEKVSKVREEEERVREMERRAIESEAQPQSSEQFQRALLSSPDCSQLWIAYMAFHLQATEIDKARGIGRKALNTISFREEQERLNVWLALLNCEHRFGTKESQQKTLEEAIQMNDPFTIHSKLLDILVETGKQQELASLVDLMARKYRREPPMYLATGKACFKLALVDKARNVMQRALALLEKKEHVTVLVQFALMERQHGANERAEALFEQVLAVYPQRVDVCAVYVDMLVKAGELDRVRQVMERMTSQNLPARKMKAIYKKWIESEEKIGDKSQVERIQQRAMEYIDKAKF